MLSPALKRYGLALNRYKWPCLASFLGVTGLATALALQPPPATQYRAEGVLVQTAPPVPDSPDQQSTPPRPQAIISENSLLSDRLLQRVSEQLGATTGVETQPDSVNQRIDIAPETLRNHTKVQINGEPEQAQRVTVQFTWPNSDQAPVILGQMLESMVTLSLEDNQAQLATITKALETQLSQVNERLQGLEESLTAYDREQGLAIQAAADGSLLEAISAGREQQRQSEIALAAVDSQIQSLQQQLGLSPQEALTATALSADPVIAELRSQIADAETQLELLSPNFREAHPTIQDLTASLMTYNTLLEKRAKEVISGNGLVAFAGVSQILQKSSLDPARADLASQLVALNNEGQAILQQQQVLTQSTAELEQDYTQIPNLQLTRARQVQQIELDRALYDQIKAKYIDAQASKAETLSDLTISEDPVTNVVPQIVLNPKWVIALGSLLGLILAGTLARLLDLLDGTLRTGEEIEAILDNHHVPILKWMPRLPASPSQELRLMPQANSPYEGLRNELKQRVNPSASDSRARVILLTSCRDGEGKTMTAFNLALASAHAGWQTLILEVDLHKASYCEWLGVQPPAEAINDPLGYYAGGLQSAIQSVPQVNNLYILPSPGPQDNAPAILESGQLTQVLANARPQFDLIILDAPSLNRSSGDGLALSHTADGLVLITRPGFTQQAELEAELEQLSARADLTLLGAVVNGADS
jgi:uncharacterized protein involved in exopolysaccharide biosynthesis/Mrp family chromosome partitioning ATPase